MGSTGGGGRGPSLLQGGGAPIVGCGGGGKQAFTDSYIYRGGSAYELAKIYDFCEQGVLAEV